MTSHEPQKNQTIRYNNQIIRYNNKSKLATVSISFMGAGAQGKGEFTMEYLQHGVVPQDVQMQLVSEFKQARSSS